MALNQMRRLVSQEDQSITPRADVQRSRFVGSWAHKTTFDAGQIIPFMVEDVMPGDHLKYDVTAFLRIANLIFPMMDSQRVDTFFFYVPYRILWSNFARFMGEQDNPGDSIDYTIPQLVSDVGGFQWHSLGDHFGLPVQGQLDGASTISVTALPFRAYKLIYHEWFRDQNSITSDRPQIGDGPDVLSAQVIRYRAKSADYFTTCLPAPQKFTSPLIALTGSARVQGLALPSSLTPTSGTPGGTYQQPGGQPVTSWSGYFTPATLGGSLAMKAASGAPGAPLDVYADLSTAAGIQINVLRQAFLVQQLLERDTRGGTRYAESVLAHFNVRVPDYRTQRPEYIGGGSSMLNITPVAQTAPGADDSVVGQLGAAGTAVGEHRASYAAQEHGLIMGLINVKSELSYQQGIPRYWSKRTRLELFYPSLAGLSEQAVLRKEIYANGILANDDAVFGYNERYQEYRTRYSEVTGYFRSMVTGTLDPWHLGQRFLTAPVLGPTFINDTPPMERVLAASTEAANQHYLADILIRRDATRPVPMFGLPVTLGRF